MKKHLLFFASILAAAAAFAAWDLQTARAIPVGTNTVIAAGATNTTDVTLFGLHGNAELFVYASAATNRTALNVTLWCTNDVSGWAPYAVGSFAATNAGVHRVTFPGEFVTRQSRVSIGSIGAPSECWALIVAY